ncbi:MAG TPA: tetratricopeptide repeat protein, partial [Acetobacteraceae bacterium]|nr:tetratricopeptide repeat protein [Acetobacteraceae bacterium]
DAGDVDSMRALGPMYIGGRGVGRDAASGIDWLRRAAEKGSTGAELDLSQLYLNGAPSVPKDRPEAMKWLGASAAHGDVTAMVNLGYMAVNGSADSPADLVLGYCWLVRAAMVDQPDAQEKLSMLFSDGAKDNHGVVIAPDLVQADLWFRVAARSPYHENTQIRAHIEPQLTTDQLSQAKRLFEAWQPRVVEQVRTLTIPLPPLAHGACPPMR